MNKLNVLTALYGPNSVLPLFSDHPKKASLISIPKQIDHVIPVAIVLVHQAMQF